MNKKSVFGETTDKEKLVREHLEARIAELESKVPKEWEVVLHSVQLQYLETTLESHEWDVKQLEAKLSKVREWAERASRINAGSDYERDDRDQEREQCGDEVLAILDGKDAP